MITIEKHGILLSPTQKRVRKIMAYLTQVFIKKEIRYTYYIGPYRMVISQPFGYAKTEGPLGLIERHEKPLITCDFQYENHGVEDARVTKIDDIFYLVLYCL